MSRYKEFDRSRISLRPLSEREHDIDRNIISDLIPPAEPIAKAIIDVADDIIKAKNAKSSIIFLCGAHVLRSGVQRYLFDLMEKGCVSAIACNGACAIHDFEFALIGATTESVSKYISDGSFGLWEETGRINSVISKGWHNGLGIGESLGREISVGNYPHKDISLFSKAWNLHIPVTVHVGIGYDIIHEHPNMDAAATGAASYRDFLIFAKVLENLEGGCACTFGSAVMAPEVFLKALAMVRNVARQGGRSISRFTSLVCDVRHLEEDISQEASKTDERYYFRPWKTLLTRVVAQTGKSFYVQGGHEHTIPSLWKAVIDGLAEKNEK